MSEADKARIQQTLATEQARAEHAFATDRGTPLEEDERVAGDRYEALWPAYVAAPRQILELMSAGDIAQARTRLNALSLDEFKEARECLHAMIHSIDRQIKQGAEGAQALKVSATLMLSVGIVIAFVVAAVLGMLVTRMTTRPRVQQVPTRPALPARDWHGWPSPSRTWSRSSSFKDCGRFQ